MEKRPSVLATQKSLLILEEESCWIMGPEARLQEARSMEYVWSEEMKTEGRDNSPEKCGP